jgi:hypothetical protein
MENMAIDFCKMASELRFLVPGPFLPSAMPLPFSYKEHLPVMRSEAQIQKESMGPIVVLSGVG